MHIRSVSSEYIERPVQNIAGEIASEAKQPASSVMLESNPSKLSIIAQEYNIDETRMKFSLLDNYGHVLTLTAAEISANQAMVHALSKQELNRISYVAGYEASNAEPDE